MMLIYPCPENICGDDLEAELAAAGLPGLSVAVTWIEGEAVVTVVDPTDPDGVLDDVAVGAVLAAYGSGNA